MVDKLRRIWIAGLVIAGLQCRHIRGWVPAVKALPALQLELLQVNNQTVHNSAHGMHSPCIFASPCTDVMLHNLWGTIDSSFSWFCSVLISGRFPPLEASVSGLALSPGTAPAHFERTLEEIRMLRDENETLKRELVERLRGNNNKFVAGYVHLSWHNVWHFAHVCHFPWEACHARRAVEFLANLCW